MIYGPQDSNLNQIRSKHMDCFVACPAIDRFYIQQISGFPIIRASEEALKNSWELIKRADENNKMLNAMALEIIRSRGAAQDARDVDNSEEG